MLHGFEIGPKLIPIQPIVHFLRAHQVADDPQGVAPAVQFLDGFDPAVGDHPFALGFAVSPGERIRRGFHPVPGQVKGQPTGPQNFRRRFAVKGESPVPVFVVTGFDHVPVIRFRVGVHMKQFADALFGRVAVRFILPYHPESIAQIHKNRVNHRTAPPFCRIGRFKASVKR